MTVESSKYTSILHENYSSSLLKLDPPQSPASVSKCCENPEIIESRGSYICRNCAIVHGQVMKNYINYDIDANNTHVNRTYEFPPYYYGCRTVFSVKNLPPKKKVLYNRLSRLNRYYRNSYEYNLTSANKVLWKLAGQLEIPFSIRQYTIRIYIKLVRKGVIRGRSIKSLMAASAYIACVQNKFKRSIEEFSKVTQIPVKIFRKNYRLILKELKLTVSHTSALEYISQYCIKLRLSTHFQKIAQAFLKIVSKNGIFPNSSPRSYAVGIIYLVSKKYLREKSITQRDLKMISRVSEVTIRKYVKLFKSKLDLEVVGVQLGVS